MADAALVVEYQQRRTVRRGLEASTDLTVEERQRLGWGASPEQIAAFVMAPPSCPAHSTRRYCYPPEGAVHRFKRKNAISSVNDDVFPTQYLSRETAYYNGCNTSSDMDDDTDDDTDDDGMVFRMEV